VLAQRNLKVNELTNTPISANAANGALITWAMLDFSTDTFTIQTQVRKARQLLLAEMSKSISIVVIGEPAQRKLAAELAVYGAWVNGIMLPEHKKIDKRKPLRKIELFGFSDKQALASLKAQAEGNILCRELTVLPPNELTPALYRARVKNSRNYMAGSMWNLTLKNCVNWVRVLLWLWRRRRCRHRTSTLHSSGCQTNRWADRKGSLLRYR